MGGKQEHADHLLEKHPHLQEHNPVLMPEATMNKAFAAGILASPSSYPSTGFVGVQAALHCTPPSVKLHLFGFNWSKKTWAGHNVSPLHSLCTIIATEGGLQSMDLRTYEHVLGHCWSRNARRQRWRLGAAAHASLHLERRTDELLPGKRF